MTCQLCFDKKKQEGLVFTTLPCYHIICSDCDATKQNKCPLCEHKPNPYKCSNIFQKCMCVVLFCVAVLFIIAIILY